MTFEEWCEKHGEFISEKMNCTSATYEDLAHTVWDAKQEIQQRTLRDEFAIAALEGILSHHGGTEGDFPMIAKDAYQIADAMLKEREK